MHFPELPWKPLGWRLPRTTAIHGATKEKLSSKTLQAARNTTLKFRPLNCQKTTNLLSGLLQRVR